MTEAPFAPLRAGQLGQRDERHVLDGLDHELGYPVPPPDREGIIGVGVDQEDLDLAPVAGVDQSGGVEAGDAVAVGQPGAGLDEGGVPLGHGHRQPGRNQGPATPRGQGGILAGDEVGAGVAGPGVGRDRQIGVEPENGHLEHTGTIRSRAVLAWMDLEMTGLDPAKDVIVEIACLLTDDQLEIVAEGPDVVVHATEAQLADMQDVVRTMHSRSGLLDAIRRSRVSLEQAGAELMEFLRKHISEPRTVPLCGNSIGTDRRFLSAHLPEVEDFFHYRSIDVSTVKELCRRWYPDALAAAPPKKGGHRALDDIRESLEELRYYRGAVFRDPATDPPPTSAPAPPA